MTKRTYRSRRASHGVSCVAVVAERLERELSATAQRQVFGAISATVGAGEQRGALLDAPRVAAHDEQPFLYTRSPATPAKKDAQRRALARIKAHFEAVDGDELEEEFAPEDVVDAVVETQSVTADATGLDTPGENASPDNVVVRASPTNGSLTTTRWRNKSAAKVYQRRPRRLIE